MTDNYKDFPYEEIRDENGDYFGHVDEALIAGFEEDQIWSVVEVDSSFSYGPSHHFVNLVGYIATNERHDGKTYYHEDALEMAD